MPRKVWKFRLPDREDFTIEMPHGAVIVSVGQDGQGKPCLWAQVYPEGPPDRRRFAVVATGESIADDRAQHRGSWVNRSSGLVWHLYELPLFPQERRSRVEA